jgi:hypothetical protein
MQSATELIERVRGMVGDKALVPRIFQNLNDGLAQVVRNTRPPDLQISEEIEVIAGSASVTMPELFFGPRIFYARNLTTNEVIKPRRIYYRNTEFYRDYPRVEQGPIIALLLRGSRLHVHGIPRVTENLEVKFLAKPTYFLNMDDDGSGILYLPERLGEKALVFYAAMEEFRIMEDGTDGKQHNFESMKLALMQVEMEIMSYFGVENFEDGGSVIAADPLGISGYNVRVELDNL